jgi:peroxiredoxin Q/BCP
MDFAESKGIKISRLNRDPGTVVGAGDRDGDVLGCSIDFVGSGCTAEACSLRDNYDKLKSSGYEVLGVSTDPVKSHKKFVDKYSLPFRLLSDTEKTVSEAFGVYGLKKFMGKEYMGINRTTFLIDEKGIITEVIVKVDTKKHAEQIL